MLHDAQLQPVTLLLECGDLLADLCGIDQLFLCAVPVGFLCLTDAVELHRLYRRADFFVDLEIF